MSKSLDGVAVRNGNPIRLWFGQSGTRGRTYVTSVGAMITAGRGLGRG